VTTTTYGQRALETLREAVAEVKRDDPMAPVTVLVPNNIAGIVARRFLAHGLVHDGNGIAGIYFSTLPRLAEQLATPALTAQGRRPATRPVTAATIRGRLDTTPGIFEPVAAHPSTSRALAQAMTSLSDVDDTALTTLATASNLVKDVVRLHRETTAELRPQWYDTTDLLKTAAKIVLEEASATIELGPVLLYLPQDFNRAESLFAESLASRTDVRVIAGLTGNARADRGVLATLTALAPGFEPSEDADEPCASRVLNASDSDDEVRCIVREVVQTLQVVRAHKVAVLYADRSPYARLLHEHLGAAGITINGPGVRPVNERAVSRLMLGLLETGRSDFRRADVLRTLGEVSVRDFTGQRISVSRWERMSREAGVVSGEQWDTRLAAYADKEASAIEAEKQKDEPYDSTIARAERNRNTAIALRQFIIDLQARFVAAAETHSWADLGTWAGDLFHALLPATDVARMPLEEQYGVGVIDRTLSGLAALDGTASAPTLDGLEEVLALELEAALPRVGRFGEGVLVAPVTHAIGLDLDVIYLVGLSEDLFPGRLRDDSLLPERVRALTAGQLPSTRARVEVKHRSLLAAFTSANLVVASFPRGDLRRHTNRLPSRWLLPTLRQLSAIPALAATEWRQASIDTNSVEWLTTSHSYAGSLITTNEPSTKQEWRIHAAFAGDRLDEPAIDASRAMTTARDSDRFTRFDGNLQGHVGLPDFVHGARLVSPTRLERYAICPHQYFVQRMLHVEPVEAPEEVLEISPMEIGSLIHECFDELISGCADRGELPDYGKPWTDEQRRSLQEIAVVRAATFEADGRTGHPMLWGRARTRIMADLDWMLDDDNQWRAEQDARVVASELAFGMHGEPEVEIKIDGDGIVRFRGSADKVDERRDGTLLVTDIKSGSIRTFKGLSEADPVARGEKLQLPVYAHAARARYGSPSTRVEAMYWFVRKDRGKRPQVPLTAAVQELYAETVGVLVKAMASGVFPPRAPDQPDFKWVLCPYCNPDGLGHHDVRRRWEAKRLRPELVAYTGVVEHEALAGVVGDDPGHDQNSDPNSGQDAGQS